METKNWFPPKQKFYSHESAKLISGPLDFVVDEHPYEMLHSSHYSHEDTKCYFYTSELKVSQVIIKGV